jgi:A/G-specific adenine glycosylase
VINAVSSVNKSMDPICKAPCENTGARMRPIALITPRSLARFQSALLRWFRAHRRDLPWRASRDPYRIWVAEIMLQQTRIAAVLPYYERFLARFQDIESLANAREEEVLMLWSGLGYYSRARNLHRAAKEIVLRQGGEFPRCLPDALALPGIGRYTAAAILSIAYDQPVAALDGNIARVLARLGAVRGDLGTAGRWQRLSKSAQQLLAEGAPGEWNQALMELGETICTPRSPRCADCPISPWCRAKALGIIEKIPAPRRKRTTVRMKIAAAILRDPRGRTLLVRDPGAHDRVIFSGLWQFPAVAVSRHAEIELAAHVRATLGIHCTNGSRLVPLPPAEHAVTFRTIALLPFLAHVPHLPRVPRTRILRLERLLQIPVSSATRKIALRALSRSVSGGEKSIGTARFIARASQILAD